MKTGLVLEGGGMRGIYTAGVLDAMDAAGLRAAFDGVIGVSAGAVHGCSFVSGQRGRSIRYFTRYCRDRGFMSVYSLLTTGSAVGEKLCYHDIPERLDPFDNEAFMASPTAVYVGVTNLETGEGEYPRGTDLFKQMDWLRASASMPYVSRIVTLDGKPYLDGGIADSVPLAAFERMGYARNVVVLTKEEGFKRRSDNIPRSTSATASTRAFLRRWRVAWNCARRRSATYSAPRRRDAPLSFAPAASRRSGVWSATRSGCAVFTSWAGTTLWRRCRR